MNTGKIRSVALIALALNALTVGAEAPTNMGELEQFARQYTAAWCSQDASSLAAMYEADGSLTINEGDPSTGRAAIEAAVQDFMTAYPDMIVRMEGLDVTGDQVVYRWTFSGTHDGPGGTGSEVHISGYEEWTMSPHGLIARSNGHYDAAEWERQLQQNEPPVSGAALNNQ